MKTAIFLLVIMFFLNCGSEPAKVENKNSADTKGEQQQAVTTVEMVNKPEEITPETAKPTPKNAKNEPRTVREFFNLLPPKYFTLEGCEPKKDANCTKARAEYIKTFLEIEDTKNGYWKSGCDGAQSCLEMALFKRPDGTYVVLVMTEFELGENSYFLEYKNGQWTDIGARLVPEYSTKNTYVPPRVGTTVEVFKKNFPEPNYSERGAKIYSLNWKDGKFLK